MKRFAAFLLLVADADIFFVEDDEPIRRAKTALKATFKGWDGY